MQKQSEITPLERVTIKANGIVVWNIQSESGHTYHVTVFEGRISSCERADGEPCPAWRYHRSCHHASLVQAREDARIALEHKIDADTTQHVEDDRRNWAPLNGQHSFSLLK